MDQLHGVPFEGLLLNIGEYGDTVRYEDGSPIRWVELFDPNSDRAGATLTATLAPDIDPITLPEKLTAIKVLMTVAAKVTGAGHPRLKFRVTAIDGVERPKPTEKPKGAPVPA
jgi:hypothetical protein